MDENKRKESIALLTYMVHHNDHHSEELEDVANGLEGEAKKSVEEAISLLKKSNEKLQQALDFLKGE